MGTQVLSGTAAMLVAGAHSQEVVDAHIQTYAVT
jgi:hypothetical protein